MRSWIGKSVIFIGIVHSVFGFVVFRSTLADLVNEGLVNTVNGQPEREFAFWFLFFGFMAIIAGSLIDWCEKTFGALPGFLGWSLLTLTAALVILMPISGGWFLFIPAVGAILRFHRSAIPPMKTS
ncbi:MAG: DUF6463 family protein [Blastocatellia bacterium]